MVNLYTEKLDYKFKKGSKVKWNKRIFKKCPFEIDETKTIDKVVTRFIGIEGIRMWWNWWEIVPTDILKKPIYWIKFWYWYRNRFLKL